MRFTVGTRIITCVSLLMLFVVSLLITGIAGLGSINSSVRKLTEEAIPLSHNVNVLSSSLLQIKVNLIDYQAIVKSTDLAPIEQNYNQEQKAAEEAQAKLVELSNNSKELNASAKKIAAENTQVFSLAKSLMNAHKQMVNSLETVQKQKRQTLDLLDNITSNSVDLQSSAGAQRAQYSALNDELEKMSASITKALENNVAAAATGAKMKLKSLFSTTDSIVENLGSAGENTTQGELIKHYAEMKKISLGENGLMDNYIASLKLKKQNQEEFTKLNAQLSGTLTSLNTISLATEKYADDTKNSAENTVVGSRTILIAVGIISLIASFFIATWITQSIRKPLQEIVSVVTQVAAGDLTQKFKSHNRDEFGDLATDLDKLVFNLRNIVVELTNTSNQLSATADQTSAASRNSLTNINAQKMQTDMIAAAVEEMSLTVDEVARNATSTLKEVETAYTKVTQGEKVLQENIGSITSLARDIETSAEVIEKLNERSNDIGSVLDVIRSVAEQTNLLALNAAIEAARAGEQGRGFAVVADEVRTLASRAQQSTTEIQAMIQQLQTGASHAVETMTNCRHQAQSRVESIAGAGKVLTSIAATVTTIKDMSYQIAAASEEQSSTTKEQNRNILAIVDAAELTAQAASENQAASEHLATMAKHQLNMIQKFIV